METLLVVFLFLVMLAAPCIIAARGAGRLQSGENNAYGEMDEEPESNLEEQDDELPALLAAAHIPNLAPNLAPNFAVDRPLTLSELATRAESDARIAQELAHEAHYAALAAAAYAARLRADAAIEAVHMAEQAIREAPSNLDRDYFVTQASPLDSKTSRAA